MALAIDASSPSIASTPTAISVTTGSFTPPAGALLVALFGGNGAGGADISVTSVTNSGTALTWTRRARKNVNASSNGGAGQNGGTEIWTAVVGASAAMTVTVSGVGSGTGSDKVVQVLVFTGADTTNLANVAGASSNNGIPSVVVAACLVGSHVVSAASDWNATGAGTVGSGQTMVSEYQLTGQTTIHAWRTTATLSAAGSQTMNLTAPSGETYNQSAMEIRAATAATGARPSMQTPGRRVSILRAASY